MDAVGCSFCPGAGRCELLGRAINSDCAGSACFQIASFEGAEADRFQRAERRCASLSGLYAGLAIIVLAAAEMRAYYLLKVLKNKAEPNMVRL